MESDKYCKKCKCKIEDDIKRVPLISSYDQWMYYYKYPYGKYTQDDYDKWLNDNIDNFIIQDVKNLNYDEWLIENNFPVNSSKLWPEYCAWRRENQYKFMSRL